MNQGLSVLDFVLHIDAVQVIDGVMASVIADFNHHGMFVSYNNLGCQFAIVQVGRRPVSNLAAISIACFTWLASSVFPSLAIMLILS